MSFSRRRTTFIDVGSIGVKLNSYMTDASFHVQNASKFSSTSSISSGCGCASPAPYLKDSNHVMAGALEVLCHKKMQRVSINRRMSRCKNIHSCFVTSDTNFFSGSKLTRCVKVVDQKVESLGNEEKQKNRNRSRNSSSHEMWIDIAIANEKSVSIFYCQYSVSLSL
ncbi:unnamed protein product [Albugo candida]|uniref:Uncharacterized protein n=1 Tax=Albugo candida TaxID=65357 RepID=A0A024GK19_9STRA|nr:unnamed protein product [Albugo candida]|eukprot:CCI47112.1 unnamed protein product [Albugo candida]